MDRSPLFLKKTPRAFVFDLDNTLVDRDRAWRAFFAECNLSEEDQERARAFDASGYAPRKRVCQFVAEMSEGRFRHADEVWTLAKARIPALTQPFQGAAALLQQLRQAGFKVGILSNGGAGQYQKARGLGEVDALRVSVDVGFEKPDARAFDEVLKALGVQACEAVFVGDHPDHDIFGAKSAGLFSVWISRQRSWKRDFEPDFRVEDLDQLRGVLSC
jgi:HAD superfamily hydrolase (TIGR01509 family)